jgi:hypothetical protein
MPSRQRTPIIAMLSKNKSTKECSQLIAKRVVQFAQLSGVI